MFYEADQVIFGTVHQLTHIHIILCDKDIGYAIIPKFRAILVKISVFVVFEHFSSENR